MKDQLRASLNPFDNSIKDGNKKLFLDDINRSCAFAGHRPAKFPWKYEENDKRCPVLKAVLTEQIKKLAAGVTDFYSGMALGTDTWAAMAVLDLRERKPAIKLHCVLPCEGQEATWPIPSQVRYKYILSEADSVEYHPVRPIL